MKKTLALLIALVMVFTCASALAEFELTTGGPAGTYYAYSNVLANYISNNTDVKITAVTSGGSAENIDKLDGNLSQLATVQNDVAYYAYNGERAFEGTPITSFTALAALYAETVQLVTWDPEIKSVADLAGKSVSIGAAGSGVYDGAVDFLAAYGMTVDDITPTYESFDSSAESLKDRKIDAAFVEAGHPTPAVEDLANSMQIYLVSLDAEHIAALQEIGGAYVETVIPAGTYKGVDEDVVTVSVKATLVANGEVSEDEAYTIVATIFENAAEIAQQHAKGYELDLEYASICGLPYHPGAAKYFDEHGITVDVVE